MGQLNGGFMFKVGITDKTVPKIKQVALQVPLNHCRRLIHQSCKVLQTLGKFFKFEITVGMNGRIWINAATTDDIIKIHDVLVKTEYVTDEDELIALVQNSFTRSVNA